MWRRENGMGLVGCILSIPVMLLGLLVLGFIFTLINQAYWDYRVEEMCEKDGGRTIYEKIVLSDEEYGALLDGSGILRIPTQYSFEEGDDYIYSFDSKNLVRKSLSLVVKESSTRVVRVKDKKVIAEQVDFIRIGGDFPFSASHASSYVCPRYEKKPFLKEIFIAR